jgi:hypothetical protein
MHDKQRDLHINNPLSIACAIVTFLAGVVHSRRQQLWQDTEESAATCFRCLQFKLL